MKIERKHIAEKIDVQDADGNRRQVLVFTALLETQPGAQLLDKARQSYLAENVRLELSDKRPVNRIDDNTFQVVTTGEILKRLD